MGADSRQCQRELVSLIPFRNLQMTFSLVSFKVQVEQASGSAQDFVSRTIHVERNYQGRQTWLSGVFVGDLAKQAKQVPTPKLIDSLFRVTAAQHRVGDH